MDCSVRLPGSTGFVPGIARYDGDMLLWYRLPRPAVRPACTFRRSALDVVEQRVPDSEDTRTLSADLVVARCTADGRTFELAFSESALTGFLAWLEAPPPGQYPRWW